MRGKTSAAPNSLGERHAWKVFMKSPSPIYGYGFAIMAVGVALLGKLLLDPLTVQDTPFLLVFSAVMVSAWYGGLGPGFLATALAALITDYYFLRPVESFSDPNLQAIPLFTFVLEGLLICLLVEALRSARLRSEESARETESHQESLRESERLYRAVVENAAENIFLVDAETKRILQTNPAFNRSLGYAPEELKEMTLYDIVAADRHSIDRNIERIRGGGTFAGERSYRCKNGTFIDVEVSASAISYSGREAMCVVAHDVTERKRSEVALRRSLDALLALYEAGQILSSSLERAEIGAKLLEITQRVFEPTAAAIDLLEGEQLSPLRTVGPEDVLTSVRNSHVAEAARREILRSEMHCSFELDGMDNSSWVGLFLPLRVRDQTIGLLEIYGHSSLKEGEVVETCESLANLAASALENARLYEELAQRERQLHELVGRLLTAQEEERRRVAYDVHDGLAQTAAAAYQHLQGFARLYPPGTARGREELEEVLELVRLTVREARQVISHLRPTTLDDFGLAAAIQQQISSLRAEGRQVEYIQALGDGRLPTQVETALFRIAQEALTNVRKHAGPAAVRVVLERMNGAVRLSVKDEGSGFQPADQMGRANQGERIGLSGMRERVSLLDGRFDVHSAPGAGTMLVAEVPLSKHEGAADDG